MMLVIVLVPQPDRAMAFFFPLEACVATSTIKKGRLLEGVFQVRPNFNLPSLMYKADFSHRTYLQPL